MLWMILRESLFVTMGFFGLAAGVPIALLSGGVMQSMLYGLQRRDPLTIIISLVVVAMVTLTASLLPARQAASVEPMRALRAE